MKRLLMAAILLWTASAVAQQYIPPSNIMWSLSTGSGVPAIPCAAFNYGAPYTDTTNNNFYICTPGGWLKINGTLTPGGLSVFLSSNQSFTTTSFVALMTLPAVSMSGGFAHAQCVLRWESTSAAIGLAIGVGQTVSNSIATTNQAYAAASSAPAIVFGTVSGTSTTAVSGVLLPASISTPYLDLLDIQVRGSSSDTVTVYIDMSSTGAIGTILAAGSSCGWLP